MIGRVLSGLMASAASDPPQPFFSFLSGRSPSGAVVTPGTARTISAVFRAVEVRSNSFKAMPFSVLQKSEDSGVALRRTDHAAFQIMSQSPNPTLRPGRCKKLIGATVDLWGNCYFEIERAMDGEPLAIWPVHPSRVRVEIEDDGSVFYNIHSNPTGDGRTKTVLVYRVPARNMLHFIDHSDDGVRGISKLGFARRSLGLVIDAEEYGCHFFRNNAQPSVLLKTTMKVSDDDKRKFRDSWKEIYGRGGTDRMGVGIADLGFDVSTIGIPNTDAQWLEGRKESIVDVARWFSTPPTKLYDYTHAHYNNIESAKIDYVEDAMLPLAIEVEEECNAKLLTGDDRAAGVYCKLKIEGLLRADIKTRNEVYEIKRRNGVLNADRWLALEDEDEIGGEVGQAYLLPTNMASAERVIRGEFGQQAKADANRNGGADDDRESANRAALGREALSRAWEGTFAAACGRLDRKREKRVGELSKNQATAEKKIAAFLVSHGDDVILTMTPIMEGYAATIKAACGRGELNDAERGLVFESAKRLACSADLKHETMADVERMFWA